MYTVIHNLDNLRLAFWGHLSHVHHTEWPRFTSQHALSWCCWLLVGMLSLNTCTESELLGCGATAFIFRVTKVCLQAAPMPFRAYALTSDCIWSFEVIKLEMYANPHRASLIMTRFQLFQSLNLHSETSRVLSKETNGTATGRMMLA